VRFFETKRKIYDRNFIAVDLHALQRYIPSIDKHVSECITLIIFNIINMLKQVQHNISSNISNVEWCTNIIGFAPSYSIGNFLKNEMSQEVKTLDHVFNVVRNTFVKQPYIQFSAYQLAKLYSTKVVVMGDHLSWTTKMFEVRIL